VSLLSSARASCEDSFAREQINFPNSKTGFCKRRLGTNRGSCPATFFEPLKADLPCPVRDLQIEARIEIVRSRTPVAVVADTFTGRRKPPGPSRMRQSSPAQLHTARAGLCFFSHHVQAFVNRPRENIFKNFA
jgi:hypothetical protein